MRISDWSSDVCSSDLAVDTTSAVVGTTLTLDPVESLPTGRNYQSYLQIVPGVKPSSGGNPSSKSGVNYTDIGGNTGTSSDNVYYSDGVDVTDSTSAKFGPHINSATHPEHHVIHCAVTTPQRIWIGQEGACS